MEWIGFNTNGMKLNCEKGNMMVDWVVAQLVSFVWSKLMVFELQNQSKLVMSRDTHRNIDLCVYR